VFPALLLACSAPFPCAENQVLDVNGACVSAVADTGGADDTDLDTGGDTGGDTGEPSDTGDPAPVDVDGDGSPRPEDCDDGDAHVFPGAVEARDGRDQDCDGEVDEDVPDLLFDLADTRHAVRGLGANIWPDSDAWVDPVTTLGGRLVRVGLGPVWDTTGVPVPLGGGASDYDAYVAAAMATTGFGGLDDARTTFTEIERLGLDLVLLNWEAPSEMETSGVLRSGYVEDYAHLVAALVGHLADNGIPTPWLEVTNEPDGSWNTFVYPSDYAVLLVAVRDDLDARGLVDTRILGPGLSTLAQGGAAGRFLDALTPDAVAALGAWSAHGYDDAYADGDGVDVFAAGVADFADRTRELDPDLPFLLTELASLDPTVHGVATASPLTCGDWSSTEAYGVRMLTYTLLALGEGASAALPWQAADPDWGGCWGSFGMVDVNGRGRPYLATLAALAGALPEEARFVAPVERDPGLAVGGFVADDHFVLALANPTSTPLTRTVGWLGAEPLALTERVSLGGAPFSEADGFEDLTRLSFGPGVWQDTASAEYFAGDDARLGGVAGAWLVLGEGTPITDFALDGWRWSGIGAGAFTVEASADGVAWAKVGVDEAVEAGPWNRVTFSPSAMPAGAGWIRVTWPDLDPEWALELGGATLELQPGSVVVPEPGAVPTPRVITVEVPAESGLVLTVSR
jgi:hypothetical protein